MKNFNLSSNVLAALCCLVLLATSCQDDPLESDLQPTDAVILDETLSSQALSEAPTETDTTLSFRTTLTVEEADSGEDLVSGAQSPYNQLATFLPLFPLTYLPEQNSKAT